MTIMDAGHAKQLAHNAVGDEKDTLVASPDLRGVHPKEEQVIIGHTLKPDLNGTTKASPSKEESNDRILRMRSEADLKRPLPARKASLPLHTVDTIEYRNPLTPVRRTSARTGSYDDGQSVTDTDDDVEIITDMQTTHDSDASTEAKSTITLNANRKRPDRSAVNGGVGSGPDPDRPSTPADEHFGNGVTCRFYNRERCVKGSSCPYSHASDMCSLRSRPEGKNVCIYFIHNNKCRFNARDCNYSHRRRDLEPWDDEEIARQLLLKLDDRKLFLKNNKEDKKERKKKPRSDSLSVVDKAHPPPSSPSSNSLSVASQPMHPSPHSLTNSSLSISTPTIGSVRDAQPLQGTSPSKKKTTKRSPPTTQQGWMPAPPPRHQQHYVPYAYPYPQPAQYQPQPIYPYYMNPWGMPQQFDHLQLLGLAALHQGAAAAAATTTTTTTTNPNSNSSSPHPHSLPQPQPIPQPHPQPQPQQPPIVYDREQLLSLSDVGKPEVREA